MVTWPHSGSHVYTEVRVCEDDHACATRLARLCARNPVALERLTYDRTTKSVIFPRRPGRGRANARSPVRARPRSRGLY